MTGTVSQSPFMRPSDAFTWYMERDPGLRSTVLAIAWLETPPAWEDLVRRMERATHHVPSFRQRPLEVPGHLATPRWTTDPHFDVAWHLRRVNAPAPHGRDEVLALAAQAVMTGFDRSRPLWEFTLVEGLDDGRAAVIMKMHHSLTDGVGGVQLALALFDAEPGAGDGAESAEGRADGGAHSMADGAPLPAAPPGEDLEGSRLVVEALEDHATRLCGRARSAIQSAPGAVVRVARHPFGAGNDLIETARSIARTVRPLPSALSPVMTARGPGRVLHSFTVGLDELKRAGALSGGTLNDGFLAAITGGLRHYHEQHGVTAEALTVTLPISIRKPGDPPGGNRITLQRLRVPLSVTDPLERMRAIGASCRAAQAERSLAFTDAIAAVMNLVPTGYLASVFKHVDFVATDVTGFPVQMFLCGARVTEYSAFAPTLGAALNVALFSYKGSCTIGLTVDTAAVPDHDVLAACIEEGFAEVIAGTRRGSATPTAPTRGDPGSAQAVPKTLASS